MSKAADMTALTRNVAADWVAREERMTGSRMAAYKIVAQQVGASPSWLRKFIHGDEAKQPNWTVGWNLLTAYERLCARVEQNAENERAITRALERKIHAATCGALGLVDGAPKAKTHSEDDNPR